jgi:hypothetical protein
MRSKNDTFIFSATIILLMLGTIISNIRFGHMPSLISIYSIICIIGLGIIIQLGNIIEAISNTKEETNDNNRIF